MFPPSYQSTIAPGISHHFDNILQYHARCKISVKYLKFRPKMLPILEASFIVYAAGRRGAWAWRGSWTLPAPSTGAWWGPSSPPGPRPPPTLQAWRTHTFFLLSNQKTREGRVCNGINYIICEQIDPFYHMWSYGVMVSTLDFESSDPSSSLGKTFCSFLYLDIGHEHINKA